MRRLEVFLVVVSALLLALPLAAQQQPGTVARVAVWKAKGGMRQQFEQGLKRHNEWHRKQNDTWYLETWEILTGENTGQYVRGTFGHRWEDFDAEEKMRAADAADSAANLEPYMESEAPGFYLLRSDLSLPPAGEGPSAFAQVTHFFLKSDGVNEFTQGVRRVNEAIKKTNWPAQTLWYQLFNGGEGPRFVLVVLRHSWADFQPPDKSLDAMVEEAFGKEEASSVLNAIRKNIRFTRSEILRFRADLSYRPAAK